MPKTLVKDQHIKGCNNFEYCTACGEPFCSDSKCQEHVGTEWRLEKHQQATHNVD